MKSSTVAKPKATDPISLCLMGDHGTGKTTFALQWPRPGVMDLDGNLDGPESYLRKRVKDLSYEYVQPLLDDKGRPLASDREISDRVFDGLRELIESPKVGTIIIDSATKLAESLVWWILGRNAKDDMELDMWKPWRSRMLSLVHKGRNSGKHLIFLIHEQPRYGIAPRQGLPAPQIGVTMSMPTKLQEQFGFTFTDVWRATKSGRNDKISHELHFVSDGDCNLKNSFGLVAPLPTDWTKVLPLIKHRL